MVNSIDLYTEAGEARGRQGAKSEHTGPYVSDEQRRQPGCSAGRMSRFIELTTLAVLEVTDV